MIILTFIKIVHLFEYQTSDSITDIFSNHFTRVYYITTRSWIINIKFKINNHEKVYIVVCILIYTYFSTVALLLVLKHSKYKSK